MFLSRIAELRDEKMECGVSTAQGRGQTNCTSEKKEEEHEQGAGKLRG